MKINGAIFDFDGTLFDSMSIWDTAGNDYLRSVGREPKENLRQALKPLSLYQSACYIKDEYCIGLSVDEIMRGINKTVEDFYFYTAQPKEGVIPFLEKLANSGVAMCIATATDRYQIDAALKRCGMEGFFSEIFTCTDVGHGKDEPIIFRKAMEHLKTNRSDTAVFEDAYHAIKTAKSDGFLTVAVFDEHELCQKEIRSAADFFLPGFNQVDSFWEFISE